jgi:hypothetical protein
MPMVFMTQAPWNRLQLYRRYEQYQIGVRGGSKVSRIIPTDDALIRNSAFAEHIILHA